MLMTWIDVRDRLPELEKTVLIYADSECITSPGIYLAKLETTIHSGKCRHKIKCQATTQFREATGEEYWTWSVDYITHWMELPEKPDLNRHFEGCIPIMSDCWHTSNTKDTCSLKDKCWFIDKNRHKCVDNCPQKGK